MMESICFVRGRTKDEQDVVRESGDTGKGDDEVVEDVLENVLIINNINIVYIITSTIMYCVYISHHLYEFQYYMLYTILVI